MEKMEKEKFWLLSVCTNLTVCPLKKASCLEHLNSKKGSFKAKHFNLTKKLLGRLLKKSLHIFEGE